MKNRLSMRGGEGLEFSGSELFEKLSSVLGIFEAVFAWRRALESGCWASRAAGFRSPGCIGSPTGHAPAARAPARRRRGAHACCASDGAAAVPRIPQEAQAFQPSQTRGRVRARGGCRGRACDGGAPIEADSPCPAVGCASGSCHGFDDVPEPDGVHEMTCPEASCASTECHAWDTLATRYYQASDASLNLWVLAPVALVVGLVLIVRKVG